MTAFLKKLCWRDHKETRRTEHNSLQGKPNHADAFIDADKREVEPFKKMDDLKDDIVKK